ncbi:MAG TPA: hypothetical protein VMZ28_19655, partial [Kofleriaceae bacterium]|nr:hypothetical protein [Kofleriaceae bacterium]
VVDQGGPGAAPGSVADGAACTAAADCASGICEGEGCAPNGGVCASKSRACTRDLRAYCGCDGVTFRSSGSCPGGRFSARGECPAAHGGVGTPDGTIATGTAKDGAECRAGSDCASNICEGVGCGATDHGVCMAKNRPCTADLRPYCGCDGATFRSSGSCPARRYSKKGECGK